MIDRRAVWLTALLTLSLSAAANADAPCPIPPDLALRNVELPLAHRAAARDHKLTVLTFGGDHTAGTDAGARGATYPARLEAGLAAALPDLSITVQNEALPGSTAADIPPLLPGLIHQSGARLVIWGPGGRDVALRMDLTAFRTAVIQGIEATRRSGADLVLLDTTFIPSATRMALIEPYRAQLEQAAAANHVPLLRRHDLMRHWIKDGTLNLEARDPEDRQRVARKLFACVAESLTEPLAAALR